MRWVEIVALVAYRVWLYVPFVLMMIVLSQRFPHKEPGAFIPLVNMCKSSWTSFEVLFYVVPVAHGISLLSGAFSVYKEKKFSTEYYLFLTSQVYMFGPYLVFLTGGTIYPTIALMGAASLLLMVLVFKSRYLGSRTFPKILFVIGIIFLSGFHAYILVYPHLAFILVFGVCGIVLAALLLEVGYVLCRRAAQTSDESLLSHV